MKYKISPRLVNRIEIVDALRGFALLGILLMHSVEHWDFLHHPDNVAEWLKPLNRKTFEIVVAHYWIKRFTYGPLEWLWRSFTFLTFSIPLKKPKLKI